MPEIADHILNHEPDAIARYNYNVSEDVDGDRAQGAQQASGVSLPDGARFLHRSAERAAPDHADRFTSRAERLAEPDRFRGRRRADADAAAASPAAVDSERRRAQFREHHRQPGRRLGRAGHCRVADRRPDAHQVDCRRPARADLRAAAQPQRARAARRRPPGDGAGPPAGRDGDRHRRVSAARRPHSHHGAGRSRWPAAGRSPPSRWMAGWRTSSICRTGW